MDAGERAQITIIDDPAREQVRRGTAATAELPRRYRHLKREQLGQGVWVLDPSVVGRGAARYFHAAGCDALEGVADGAQRRVSVRLALVHGGAPCPYCLKGVARLEPRERLTGAQRRAMRRAELAAAS